MTHLKLISIFEVDDWTLSWLDRASKHQYYGESPKDLLERLRDGDLAFWKIEQSPAKGLIGTKLIDRKPGRELWVEFMVGKGLMKEAWHIRKAIHAVAAMADAKTVAGMAVRPGLTRLYQEVLGVKPAATIFVEDTEHGR